MLPPNLVLSRKILRQSESQACLKKPVSYIAFPKRLKFSDRHSCLLLSDCVTVIVNSDFPTTAYFL